MSWRRVASIYGVLAMLAGYLTVFDRAALDSETIEAAAATSSLLEAEAVAVAFVTFRKGDRIVRAARESGSWRVVEPSTTRISPDLLEATIATLTTGQSSEKLSSDPEGTLSAYGLEAPSTTVEVTMSGAPDHSVTVSLGNSNPTRTAVYARRDDQSTIFLVGMNVSYYIDLIFDAAKNP